MRKHAQYTLYNTPNNKIRIYFNIFQNNIFLKKLQNKKQNTKSLISLKTLYITIKTYMKHRKHYTINIRKQIFET